MDPTTKTKLAINIANSWKMLSVQFIAAVTAIWTFYVSLPAICTPEMIGCVLSQETILGTIRPLLNYVPAPLLALATGLLGYFLRVKPQKNLPAEVVLAKSEDAPQPLPFIDKHK